MNKILFFGAALGLSSVMMAAYIDHGLATHITEHDLQRMATAVRYHQLYAVIIAMIGLLMPTFVKSRRIFSLAAYAFILGVLLFSFGLYIATIFRALWALQAAPVGGFMLMIGWGCLLAASLIKS